MTGRHVLQKLYWLGMGLILTTSAALAAPPKPADATPSEPENTERRDAAHSPLVDREQQLLENGYRLRQQGRDADALEVYSEAYALRHDVKPLAQMALSLEALGDWAQAHQLLQKALTDRTHPWIQSNRVLLESELARILLKLGHLTLEVQPGGARVRLNNVIVGIAPLHEPLLLNPGKSTIQVELEGYAPYRFEFEAEPATHYREVVRLRSLVSSPSPPRHGSASRATSPSHSLRQRNPLWLGTAVGGGLLATSAMIPWSIANHKVDELANSCNSDPNCPLGATSTDVRRLDRATNALLFSGLGIAATSIVLYIGLPQTVIDSSPAVKTSVTREGAILSFSGRY